MPEIRLELRLGPSTNHIYTNARRFARDKRTKEVRVYMGRMLSPHAMTYKQEVIAAIRQTNEWQEGIRPAKDTKLQITTWLTIRSEGDRDIDNNDKLLFDAIKEALEIDDRQVYEVHAYKRVDAAARWPRIDVLIAWETLSRQCYLCGPVTPDASSMLCGYHAAIERYQVEARRDLVKEGVRQYLQRMGLPYQPESER